MTASASASRLPNTRARAEAALWVAAAVATLNFVPQLFTSDSLVDEPTWRKAIKDLPLAVIFGVALVRGVRPGGAIADRARRIYGIPFLVLIAFMAIDFLVRGPGLPEFLVSARYYVVYPLLVWAAFRLDLERRTVMRLSAVLCAIAVVESFLAVYEFTGVLGPTYYADYVAFGDETRARAIGTLGNPNNLAVFLALPALLLAAGVTVRGLLRWLLFGLVCVGVILTFSKGVALALAVAFLVLDHLLSREVRPLRTGAIAAVGIGAFLFATLSRADEFSTFSIFGGRGEVASDAFDTWTGDLTSFLFGEGFGSQVDIVEGGLAPVVTDNMALMLALEGGAVALGLFVIVVVQAFRALTEARRADSSPLMAALYAYAVFFLLYSPFVVNFRLFPGAMLFWLVVGVALRLGASSSASRPSS